MAMPLERSPLYPSIEFIERTRIELDCASAQSFASPHGRILYHIRPFSRVVLAPRSAKLLRPLAR